MAGFWMKASFRFPECSPGGCGHVPAKTRPIRGQCAARAGLPEELRSSFLGVETFQEYSRTCWGCLEARQGPRRSAGTARRAKETRREHEEGQGDQHSREARSQQRAWIREPKSSRPSGLGFLPIPGHHGLRVVWILGLRPDRLVQPLTR